MEIGEMAVEKWRRSIMYGEILSISSSLVMSMAMVANDTKFTPR